MGWDFLEKQAMTEAEATNKLYRLAMDISKKDFINNFESYAKTDAKAVVSDQEALVELKKKYDMGYEAFQGDAKMIAEDFLTTQHNSKLDGVQDPKIVQEAKGAYIATFSKELYDQIRGEMEKNPTVDKTGEGAMPGMAPAYEPPPAPAGIGK